MPEFAARTLRYADSDGNEKEVVLTVYLPIEGPYGGSKCEFTFEPPIYRATPRGCGVDVIHAIVNGLQVARIFLESTRLWGRIHWQGMLDCGLPTATTDVVDTIANTSILANDDDVRLAALTTRTLGYLDDAGSERQAVFTVYVPFQKPDGWKCGFAFDPWPDTVVRYGVGSDAIEAFLDALAAARRVFESLTPAGWTASADLLDCADFPIKSDRAFGINLGTRP